MATHVLQQVTLEAGYGKKRGQSPTPSLVTASLWVRMRLATPIRIQRYHQQIGARFSEQLHYPFSGSFGPSSMARTDPILLVRCPYLFTLRYICRRSTLPMSRLVEERLDYCGHSPMLERRTHTTTFPYCIFGFPARC